MTIKILEARARTDTRSGMEMTEKGGGLTEPGSSLTNVGHAASTSTARKRNSQSRMIRRAWQGAQTDVNTSLLVAIIVPVGVGLGVVVRVAVGVADIVAVGVGGDGEELIAKDEKLAELSAGEPTNFGELRICNVFAICNELTNGGEPIKGPEPENGSDFVNVDESTSASDPTNFGELRMCKVFAICNELLNFGELVKGPEPENGSDFVNVDESTSTSDPTNFGELRMCKVFAIYNELLNFGELVKGPETEKVALAANTADIVAAACLKVGDDVNSPLPANVGEFVTTREMISCCEPKDFEPANVSDFGKLPDDENGAVLANSFVAAISAELEKSGDLNRKGHPAGNDVPATTSAATVAASPFPVHFQKLVHCQIGRGDMSKNVLTKWNTDMYSPFWNSTTRAMVLPE